MFFVEAGSGLVYKADGSTAQTVGGSHRDSPLAVCNGTVFFMTVNFGVAKSTGARRWSYLRAP